MNRIYMLVEQATCVCMSLECSVSVNNDQCLFPLIYEVLLITLILVSNL